MFMTNAPAATEAFAQIQVLWHSAWSSFVQASGEVGLKGARYA
jgi:hypothetical protein